MQLEGCKELVDTWKSSRTCSVPVVSLRLAVSNVFQGFFSPKLAIFGPKLQFLKLRVRDLGILFLAATVEFLAQTLFDCTSHP